MSFMCIDLKVKQVEESIILGQDDSIKTLASLLLWTNQNEILQEEVTKLKQLTDQLNELSTQTRPDLSHGFNSALKQEKSCLPQASQ